VRTFHGDNRFAEVVIDHGGKAEQEPAQTVAETSTEPATPVFEPRSEYWASGKITLPLVTRQLAENAMPQCEHLYMLLPFVDYHKIDQLKVWINGIEALVQISPYYRAVPGQSLDVPVPAPDNLDKLKYAYYVDATRWGLEQFRENKVVLYVKWKD